MNDIHFVKLENSGKVAIIDVEFTKDVCQFKWYLDSKGYVFRYTSRYHRELLHHRIFGCKRLDHADRDRLNNKLSNLRKATSSQNNANRGKYSTKQFTSKYKGVHFEKSCKMWRVRLYFKKQSFYGGYFDSEVEAAKAADILAVKIHGNFAVLNFKNI